jgi:hypothetical protein
VVLVNIAFLGWDLFTVFDFVALGQEKKGDVVLAAMVLCETQRGNFLVNVDMKDGNGYGWIETFKFGDFRYCDWKCKSGGIEFGNIVFGWALWIL